MHPMPVRRYVIIIERQGGANISAYAPDLPGCVGSAATIAELEHEMGDAIALHIDGLRDAGEPIPQPSQLATAYVDVAM